ncbi:MAG: putative periplasmic or secreted lipoprotein [Methanosaeta sp. NSP1]|nr:MAG: putative periplasmic or secreted lipoprotein [Methanosaeta sp. NSP1]
MARLPLLSGAKAAKAFSKAGGSAARQTGSHLIMIKQGSMVTHSIPMHSEIDRGTLRKLISLAGLSIEEFMDLL